MQNSGNAPAQQLVDELAAGNDLLQLLREEQQRLIDANIEAVAAITEHKGKLLARINELSQLRQSALHAAGYEAGETGMQAWVQDAPASVTEDWNALLAVARESKELNRVNGLLISQHMVRNQAALNALQGGGQSGGGLYGPDGQAFASSGSRRLVVG